MNPVKYSLNCPQQVPLTNPDLALLKIHRECLLSPMHWERNQEFFHCGNTVQQAAQSAGKI